MSRIPNKELPLCSIHLCPFFSLVMDTTNTVKSVAADHPLLGSIKRSPLDRKISEDICSVGTHGGWVYNELKIWNSNFIYFLLCPQLNTTTAFNHPSPITSVYSYHTEHLKLSNYSLIHLSKYNSSGTIAAVASGDEGVCGVGEWEKRLENFLFAQQSLYLAFSDWVQW